MRVFGPSVLIVVLSAWMSAYCQSALPLSGCAAPLEVRSAFEIPLSQHELAKLKIKDRVALQQRLLGELLAKYPREYSLYERQIGLAQQLRMYTPDPSKAEDAKQTFNVLRDDWVKNAREHPDDPLALLLAGKIQIGEDTSEAIRLLEAAKAKAPEFPWPAHELATEYRSGKFADETKMKQNLEAFYSLCPAWTADAPFTNTMEGWMLQKDLPLMAKTAASLRAQLEKETDPKRLEDYQILWQREFLTHSPADHDALREQIKHDLRRLQSVVPNGDVEWRTFLIEGYKLSGASNEELARMQDAAAHDFPHGSSAESRLQEQWNKQHPRPDGQKDVEAWKAYYASEIDFTKQIARDFPDDAFVRSSGLLQIALDDEFISQEDGLAALDRYTKAIDEYGGYGTLSFPPDYLARFLLDHGWQPERALELLKKTETYRDGGHSKPKWQDNIADADLRRFSRNLVSQDRSTLGLILKAAVLAGKTDEALKFRAAVEEEPPTDKNALEQYWTNRARFAVLDKRPQDGVVYYRLAVESRSKAPEYHHGLLRDDLMSEFHDLWKAQGGTETAWMTWNPSTSVPSPETKAGANPAAKSAEGSATKKVETAEAKDKTAPAKESTAAAKKKAEPQGDWQNAPKDLQPFELADFSGKTWRLKNLSGKVVMITTWATWCGPCRLEDQNLEKFYEKEKGNKDLSILSFNVDENPGQVRPFMQKQGYTFPVLAAFSIPEKMKNFVPRTWIIDPSGHWLWVKNGYDETQAYADFEKEMLERIEKAKAGQ